MSFAVYDIRSDIRNLLVTPHIRARFLRIEPGEVHGMHSHDLGHEIFLILQGRLVFYIDGDERELGPGQLCVALADQIHQVRNKGDEPVIMYLSVTPHIQPTHTGRDADGTRHPHRFQPSSAYDVETDTSTPVENLVDNFAAAAEDLAATARASADLQRTEGARLKKALKAGDEEGAARIRQQMWEGVYESFRQIHSLAEVWNDLTPRAGRTG